MFYVVFHDITLWIKFISNDVCVHDVQTLHRGSRGEECSVELEVHNLNTGTTFIIRKIRLQRAKQNGRVDLRQ